MAPRLRIALLLASLFASLGADYRTENFAVEAATAKVAREVGQAAERLRRTEARKWLGKELATWPDPCLLQVTLSERVGGVSDFKFLGDRVEQSLRVDGPLEVILKNVLPHEMTHIILANHFRCPVPRWADEGIAILAEGDGAKLRHTMQLRNMQAKGAGDATLRRLLTRHDYPAPEQLDAFYAEAFGITRFLVKAAGRKEFLAFVSDAMRSDWDSAVEAHYGYRDIEELEESWRKDVLTTSLPPPRPTTASAIKTP